MGRLLLFEFPIVHTPGRTLGMAEYLSRHPSECEGSVAKAEELFNDWFTVNVVKEITPEMKRLADWRKPIRSQESRKVQLESFPKVCGRICFASTEKILTMRGTVANAG